MAMAVSRLHPSGPRSRSRVVGPGLASGDGMPLSDLRAVAEAAGGDCWWHVEDDLAERGVASGADVDALTA